jgi:ElaB/YqjD/DUF883 family membrane-anchored ribosome-binding protein
MRFFGITGVFRCSVVIRSSVTCVTNPWTEPSDEEEQAARQKATEMVEQSRARAKKGKSNE